jgi:hypothetical protein
VIEVAITPAIIVRAEEMYKAAQSSARLRFRKDKAAGNTTWTGCVGQAVFEAGLLEARIPFKFIDATTHDYEVCGLKVDVKTKAWSRPAGDDVEVSVFDYIRDHQTVNYYAFVHLQLAFGEDRNGAPSATRFQRAWLLGVMDKSQYLYLATEVKEGTVFESGHIAKASSLNLVAAKLLPVETIGGPENE